MERAGVRAGLRGAAWAGGTDLLTAIAADPGARAVEVLDRAGVDVPGLLARTAIRPGEYAGDAGAPR